MCPANEIDAAHTVQFYEDDAFLLDELSRFVGDALVGGNAALVVATSAHRDGLAQRLEARGLDVAAAVGQGRYLARDAEETLSRCLLDGWPDAARFAEVIGGAISRVSTVTGRHHQPRVAVFGEMVALLWAQGKPDAALRLEQLWNDLGRSLAFSLRCAYPIRFFPRSEDGVAMAEVCAAHGSVIPTEGYTLLSSEEERQRAVILLQQKALALDEQNRALRAAVTARDNFLAVAAHELKTPITGMRAFAQLLLRDVRRARPIAPERLETALRAIENQTGKLHRLVTRLLDSSEIEAGTLRVVPEHTDLVALARAALAQRDGATGHTFAFEGPDRLDALVDPLRFEQVIDNLLDNAATFSPPHSAVTVACRQDEEGGILLSVTDHGVGIPADQREAVFDRFHRAHGDHHLSGLGLGLSVVREIVLLHGGTIRIEEPDHGGARCVIRLPASVAIGQPER